MANIGVVFGSNAGDAQKVAEYIGAKFNSDIVDAKELCVDFLNAHDKLIFVASTHKVGELQNDFKAKLELISSFDFSGKTLALVGVGGSVKHPDDFNSGLAEFLPAIKGAKLIGATPVDEEYKFNKSNAIVDGKFIGLITDVKVSDAWMGRTDAWVEQIKGEF